MMERWRAVARPVQEVLRYNWHFAPAAISESTQNWAKERRRDQLGRWWSEFEVVEVSSEEEVAEL